MSCFFEFFKLLADNGHEYYIAGSRLAVMAATKEGTEPGDGFASCAGAVKKFLSCEAVPEDYVLRNCLGGSHYVDMAKGTFSTSYVGCSTNVFWIGRSIN